MKITRTFNLNKITAHVKTEKDEFIYENVIPTNITIKTAIEIIKKEHPESTVISELTIYSLGQKTFEIDINKFLEYATEVEKED